MPEDRPPCRDFQRGDCDRGDNCKYSHPEGGVAPKEDGKLECCNDFQNKLCSRVKCRFLHLTHEEVDIYNSTGKLPEHGGHPDNTTNTLPAGELCKDFLKGMCDRGSRCKYIHTPERTLHENGASMGGMYGKRTRVDDVYGGLAVNSVQLLEENELLKRKITDLQKQVTDLRQMNDTLYDENTRYRSKSSSATPVSLLQPQTSYPQYSTEARLPMSSNVPAPALTSGMSAYSYQQY